MLFSLVQAIENSEKYITMNLKPWLQTAQCNALNSTRTAAFIAAVVAMSLLGLGLPGAAVADVALQSLGIAAAIPAVVSAARSCVSSLFSCPKVKAATWAPVRAVT